MNDLWCLCCDSVCIPFGCAVCAVCSCVFGLVLTVICGPCLFCVCCPCCVCRVGTTCGVGSLLRVEFTALCNFLRVACNV